MLTRTFLHFPKVGERRERALWRFGFADWQAILDSPAPPYWAHFWDEWQREAEASLQALWRNDADYFAQHLPKRFWWRAFPEFSDRTLYLDIETTGLFTSDAITVVGVADSERYWAFVRGDDWDELREMLANAAIIVTYNGSNFDLPFLRSAFPDWRLPPLHLDLCFLLRRLGYKGGLKAIEARFGLQRSTETRGLDGWDAVRLWWQYVDYGDLKALEALLRYNEEDVVHLRPLLRFAYQTLWQTVTETALPFLPMSNEASGT